MKKIIFFLAFSLPIIINASTCDYAKLDEYNKMASNIEYDMNYNYSTGRYDIIFYNVYEKLSLSDNKTFYHANSKNEVSIKNIEEGKYINIGVYAPLEGCNSFIKTISIVTNYHNPFYGSFDCTEYKNILNICKEEFLTYKPTSDTLKSAIDNYKNSYREKEENEKENVEEKTFLDNIKEFAMEWGIQLSLGILTSIVTLLFFKSKFRKIKHGI